MKNTNSIPKLKERTQIEYTLQLKWLLLSVCELNAGNIIWSSYLILLLLLASESSGATDDN